MYLVPYSKKFKGKFTRLESDLVHLTRISLNKLFATKKEDHGQSSSFLGNHKLLHRGIFRQANA